jgi:hypothetical protein
MRYVELRFHTCYICDKKIKSCFMFFIFFKIFTGDLQYLSQSRVNLLEMLLLAFSCNPSIHNVLDS